MIGCCNVSNGGCHLHQCGYVSIIHANSRLHYASVAMLTSWTYR